MHNSYTEQSRFKKAPSTIPNGSGNKESIQTIKGAWKPSHFTHHVGKDADLNRGNIPCEKNQKMNEATEAVTQVLELVNASWEWHSDLVCEDTPPCAENEKCKYHIDFEYESSSTQDE